VKPLDKRTVRAWRTERGVSQEQLARAMETSAVSVRNWENGRNEPSARQLEKLATALGVRMDQIAFHKEDAMADQRAQAEKQT